MSALARQPVSITMEADQSSFQFYSSGVLVASCGANIDHSVLAVGYSTMREALTIGMWRTRGDLRGLREVA